MSSLGSCPLTCPPPLCNTVSLSGTTFPGSLHGRFLVSALEAAISHEAPVPFSGEMVGSKIYVL